MKLIRHTKHYSWLQWPVRLKNCHAEDLHVTAKFFGRNQISPEWVEQRLDLAHTIPQGHMIWTPQLFDNDAHVLELIIYPATILAVHTMFELIPDQYPKFRPHVTVPVSYWERVLHTGATPESEQLSFGELELHLGVVSGS